MFEIFRRRKMLWVPAFAFVLAACSPVVTLSDIPLSNQPQSQDQAAGAQSDAPAPDADPFEGINIRFNLRYWPDTDFSMRSVDLSEFSSGGPPPDGIPAIDRPVFESVADADTWLGLDWPVMFFEHNGVARAYPLAILIHHEIVNDVVAEFVLPLVQFHDRLRSTIAGWNGVGLWDDGQPAQLGPGDVRPPDPIVVAAVHRRSHRGREDWNGP